MRMWSPPNWNQIVRDSASRLQWGEVLHHYNEVRKAGFSIGDPTWIPPILKVCTKFQSWKQGISVHADAIKSGFETYTSVANSVMNFYLKCGQGKLASDVFNDFTGVKDSVSWNIIIHGCLDRGACDEGLGFFVQARQAGFVPNVATLILVIQASHAFGATTQGLCLHGLIIRCGFFRLVPIQNSLLSMYVRLYCVESAWKLFDEMSDRDAISWSVMISAHAKSGEAKTSLWLFLEMHSISDVDPDEFTVASILTACATLRDARNGRTIHGLVIRHGFDLDLHVENALIAMYSKCMDTRSARILFNAMPRKNIVSWNSILSGLVHSQQYLEALQLFDLMQKAGEEADEATMVILLQLWKNVEDAIQCKCSHAVIIRKGFEMNEMVLDSLLDAYSKCGLVDPAWRLFRCIDKRSLITWSTMIESFTHCNMPGEAIALFHEMRLQDKRPNSVTMLSVLNACSMLADIYRSKWAHGIVIRSGMVDGVAVGTALLEAYGKCGEIDASKRVFDEMPERNIISWTSMIAAYGLNGLAYGALALLREMESKGIKPNEITLLSVLSACSHGGLVEEGRSLFEEMILDYGIDPSSEHYSCLVDMLARAGDLNGAMEVIKKMPEGIEAGSSMWGALLSSCKHYRNSELGRGAAYQVLQLEPLQSAGYAIASAMYAADGQWSEAAWMRKLVKENGVRVVAGYSLVHVERSAHKFVAGDRTHPQSPELYSVVERLHDCIRDRKRDSLTI
ncbi:hypothetical protein ACLOJK_002411 [Asimina triloba]